MSQSVGMNLLARLLEDARLADFYRLKREYFYDNEIRTYDRINAHVIAHGVLPTLSFLQRHSDLTPPDSEDPYGVWYDEYTHRALHNRFMEMMPQLQRDIANTQSREALDRINRFIEETHDVRADGQRDLSTVVQVGQEVLTEYLRLRGMRGMSGIPSGWPTLDATSHGFQPADLILFAARPGVGKSTVAIKLALEAHRAGHIPLVVSMEMSRVQLGGRLMTMVEGLNLRSIRGGELTSFGQRCLTTAVNRFEGQHPFYLIEGAFRQNVNELASLVHSLRPGILIVDGAYLLKLATADARMPMWQKIGEIARVLKGIAATASIPVIATFQINREGGRRDRAGQESGVEHLQLSDELGQLASLVVAIFADEDGDQFGASRQRRLRILKGREGEVGQWFINWDYERMDFSEIAPPGGTYHTPEPEHEEVFHD